MNELIIGPEFELDVIYAQAMNTIFVSLFYFSMMPLMLIFGCASLFMQYFCYKHQLIRYNCLPPTYDEKIH